MPLALIMELFQSWLDNKLLDISQLQAKSLALLALVCMLQSSNVSPNAETFDPESELTHTLEFTVDDVVFHVDQMVVCFHSIKMTTNVVDLLSLSL